MQAEQVSSLRELTIQPAAHMPNHYASLQSDESLVAFLITGTFLTVMLILTLRSGVRLIRARGAPFRAKSALLSSDERRLFEALVCALGPKLIVFPRVRLADFIQVQRGARRWRRLRRMVRRRMDFVVCERATMAAVACIEVDAGTAPREAWRPDAAEVSGILGACGITYMRIPAAAAWGDGIACDLGTVLSLARRGPVAAA